MKLFQMKLFLLCLALVGALCCVQPVLAQNMLPLSNQADFQYEVFELSANVHNDGTLLVVAGKIRNMSHQKIKGKALVYLKNSADEVFNAIETSVNDNRIFGHREDGTFEVSVNIEGVTQLTNVSVEFLPN